MERKQPQWRHVQAPARHQASGPHGRRTVAPQNQVCTYVYNGVSAVPEGPRWQFRVSWRIQAHPGIPPTIHPGAAASIDADKFELICHSHSPPQASGSDGRPAATPQGLVIYFFLYRDLLWQYRGSRACINHRLPSSDRSSWTTSSRPTESGLVYTG